MTPSTRSRTAASPARSCRRTSLSAKKPRPSPNSSPSTRAQKPKSHPGRAKKTPKRGPPMLDLKAIRSEPERFKQALSRRGAADQVDELVALDARRRQLLPEVENAQAERKTLSKQIGERKQAGEDAEELMATVQGLKERVEAAKEELEQVEARLGELALTLPNIPDSDAPEGMTEEDAVVIREVGERPEFDFEPRDHLEIGTELGLIEMEKAAELSGSRFAYL